MDLVRIAARVAADESALKANILVSVTGNSEFEGDEAEHGQVTVEREDGLKVLGSWAAEGGTGSGYEVEDDGGLGHEQAAGIVEAAAEMWWSAPDSEGKDESAPLTVTWGELLAASQGAA